MNENVLYMVIVLSSLLKRHSEAKRKATDVPLASIHPFHRTIDTAWEAMAVSGEDG